MFIPNGTTGTFIFTYTTNDIVTPASFFAPTLIVPANFADTIISYPNSGGSLSINQYCIVGILKLVDSLDAALGIAGGTFATGMNSATVTLTQLSADTSFSLFKPKKKNRVKIDTGLYTSRTLKKIVEKLEEDDYFEVQQESPLDDCEEY